MTPRSKAALIGLKTILISWTSTIIRLSFSIVSMVLGIAGAIAVFFSIIAPIIDADHAGYSPFDFLLFLSYTIFACAIIAEGWALGEWKIKISNTQERALEKVCDGVFKFIKKHGSPDIPCRNACLMHKTAVFYFLIFLSIPSLGGLIVLYGLNTGMLDAWGELIRIKNRINNSSAGLSKIDTIIDRLASHAPGQVAKEESKQLFEKHSGAVPARGKQTL